MKMKLFLGLTTAMGLASAAFAQDPLSIVYIGKNTGNPYFDSITGGFEDACASLGCEFEFVAPATAEATSQIPFIEAQIQRGVEVIAIGAVGPRPVPGQWQAQQRHQAAGGREVLAGRHHRPPCSRRAP